MTHPEQSTAIQSALEALVEEGFDGMATAMQILFNEATKHARICSTTSGGSTI